MNKLSLPFSEAASRFSNHPILRGMRHSVECIRMILKSIERASKTNRQTLECHPDVCGQGLKQPQLFVVFRSSGDGCDN